jgi:hypothetical protein
MTMIIDGSLGTTFPDSSLQPAAASPYVLKNKLINGSMQIDQRNAGASLTVNSTAQKYPVDRFYCENSTSGVFTIQQSSTAPAGFNNSLVATVTTGSGSLTGSQYAAITQQIEGYNVADLSFGTANAKTVTLSFWVQSSVTGTFGGTFRNSADNRCYPFTYTINSASTWEQKSITVAGDTSGTWLTTNGVGLKVWFSLGTGPTWSGTANAWASTLYVSATGATNLLATNGATFYITGVQLEQNTSATPFERRLYNQELANCQRYFVKTYSQSVAVPTNSSGGFLRTRSYSGAYGAFVWLLPVSMRTAPTATIYNQSTSSVNSWWNADASTSATASVSATGEQSITVESSGLSTNATYEFQLTGSAEL